MASGLSGIWKLYSVLKAANLLTPELVSVLEELAQLVPQATGGSPEQAVPLSRPAELSEATPAKRMKWSCDGEDLGLEQLVLAPLLCLHGLFAQVTLAVSSAYV